MLLVVVVFIIWHVYVREASWSVKRGKQISVGDDCKLPNLIFLSVKISKNHTDTPTHTNTGNVFSKTAPPPPTTTATTAAITENNWYPC